MNLNMISSITPSGDSEKKIGEAVWNENSGSFRFGTEGLSGQLTFPTISGVIDLFNNSK